MAALDSEKGVVAHETPLGVDDAPSPSLAPTANASANSPTLSRLRRINALIESTAGFEARGLGPVPAHERQPASLIPMLLLWLSANATLLNLAVGLCGPLVFGLGFVDSALCAVFGILLGALTTAYMSVWGAESGLRTMVVARWFMGYCKQPLGH